MSDVVVDDSQSVDPLDESKLLPLNESPGVVADDPGADSDHGEYSNEEKIDEFESEDEVPGQETRPDEAVKSPAEDQFAVSLGGGE